jgi:enediyne polyketide synthase
MTGAVAIVGMGCRYADARGPDELWENVLARRRAFRRLPAERLRVADYSSPDRTRADRTYATRAAVIDGYEFDRARFRVSGSAYRTADPAHWLALEVAAAALADAGFPDGSGLPCADTGVVIGNTLTGEVSRAQTLRLRWPYVARVLGAALAAEGYPVERRAGLLKRIEADYKRPFPPTGDESLAGGLSNTIAGRICNQFHLMGGGYTVDAACASSLLAVAQACAAVADGELEVAIAGGVDLSLDPFELVGFAKAGALADGEMRVFDQRPTGFLPGEGCGMVVLMRAARARESGRCIHAVIRGWGVSSDGSGSITRPEVGGQSLALRRAYSRAGVRAADVGYFEGHGTGTEVGDRTEIETLIRARSGADARPAVVGTVKANVGHTKAAAGAAGLIKAATALSRQVLPPTTGCVDPHPDLAAGRGHLRAGEDGRCWPADQPLLAGVSGMGFGGINVHLVLEGASDERRAGLTAQEQALLRTPQDAELFCLGGPTHRTLAERVGRLIDTAGWVSDAQLADLAAHLVEQSEPAPVRAAVVASTPAELTDRLASLRRWLIEECEERIDGTRGVFLSTQTRAPLIGFVFPGQASPVYRGGGAWARRFDSVRHLFAETEAVTADDERIQTLIATSAVAGLRILSAVGLKSTAAVGHSLGELVALHHGGALDEAGLLRTVAARGRAMAATRTGPRGAMAAVLAGPDVTHRLVNGGPAVIACLNSPGQTVVAGEVEAVRAVMERAAASGVRSTLLPVGQAFHTPLVAAAAEGLSAHLRGEKFRTLSGRVFSALTGGLLPPNVDLREHLARHITSPVRFAEAVGAAGPIDLWVEVGPGQTLVPVMRHLSSAPIVSLDAGGSTLGGLLCAVGAAFALGAPMDIRRLFVDRFTRPISPDDRPKFLANPCELAPEPESEPDPMPAAPDHVVADHPPAGERATVTGAPDGPADTVRRLIAERVELPLEAIRDEHHLLRDLHLSSIVVGQLVAEAVRHLGLSPPAAPTEFAALTVAQLVQALAELGELQRDPGARGWGSAGIDSWTSAFTVEWVDRPLSPARPTDRRGEWRVFAPAGHPLTGRLGEALRTSGRGGVAVCLPPNAGDESIPLLLAAAEEVSRRGGPGVFVQVQQGRGAAGFAKTLHLERPDWSVCVVTVAAATPGAVEWVTAEVAAVSGFAEARYDDGGRRQVPVLRPLPPADPVPIGLGPADVLLVTGGGKGIAAECAAALAERTGVRLALVGRSDPAVDAELADNLARLERAGARVRYYPADVTDSDSIGRAVATAGRDLGPVTAVLHGAGRNQPRSIPRLTAADFRSTVAPKITGIRNVLAALDPERLKLAVVFGSLIAHSGLPGEADYAVANEWLADWAAGFAAEHPRCRCVAVEWSVWSGVGMGERLGRVEALAAQGIAPISPDRGVEALTRLLARPVPPAVVLTGRAGGLPTLEFEQRELPFHRFLERPLVHYPGLELVAESALSVESDPYLADHAFQGQPLFPAALGLEAMGQAASALLGAGGPLRIESARFDRPIPVPSRGTTVRVAALRRETGEVEVAIRCDQTDFQSDHFRAVYRAAVPESAPASAPPPVGEPLPLVPARDLYGGLLFQAGRFRRVRAYAELEARRCVAELQPGIDRWFGPYLPADLVLGDPGTRDAAIHAVQACIPHGVVVPVAVDRIVPGPGDDTGGWVTACERSGDGQTFVYDLEVVDSAGRLRERWEGLRLRKVADAPARREWPAVLLAPYVERRLAELAPGSGVRVVVEVDGSSRERSDRGLGRLVGVDRVQRRPDGKPVVPGVAVHVSVAHAGPNTLVVAAGGPTACDLEPVAARPPAVWGDLLGRDGLALARLLPAEAGDDPDTAATRVWVARECLKKVGASADAPVGFVAAPTDGWAQLRSGRFTIATLAVGIRELFGRAVLGVLVEGVS